MEDVELIKRFGNLVDQFLRAYLYDPIARLLDGERVPAEPNSQIQTELRLTGPGAGLDRSGPAPVAVPGRAANYG